MGDEALKLKVGLPKLTRWDLAAIGVAVLGVVLLGLNWGAPQKSLGGPGPVTLLFVVVHLAVCLGSLMILGKTAKEGTLWGNLAAVAGMFIGMGGVLLAAALWAAA